MSSLSPEKKKKKKKGRIKRLSGFITGESRREKKARKAAERAAAGKPPNPDGEEESVYGIDVDDMSMTSEIPGASTAPAGSPPKNLLGPKSPKTDDLADRELTFLSPKVAPALQVILLLMDPKTRRFELLQLEFDSNKALVSDVIAQIPMSVTEEQLRLQQYDGVCDRGGMEMIKTMRLSEFCKTNEVVLAIPSGMSASDCARLARPILADDGVISMLRASGINTDPVPVPPAEQDRDIDDLYEEITEKAVAAETNSVWISVIIIAIIAIILQGAQMYITAPLRPGSVLQPGMWMSKCGLLSFMPICENAGLEMKEDGVLTLYGSDGSVQWKLQGGKCRAHDTECEPGLVVKDDGNLVIGGKSITSVTIKGDAPLSPWPFEREPKLRVVRK
jgi:hypothetical protein